MDLNSFSFLNFFKAGRTSVHPLLAIHFLSHEKVLQSAQEEVIAAVVSKDKDAIEIWQAWIVFLSKLVNRKQTLGWLQKNREMRELLLKLLQELALFPLKEAGVLNEILKSINQEFLVDGMAWQNLAPVQGDSMALFDFTLKPGIYDWKRVLEALRVEDAYRWFVRQLWKTYEGQDWIDWMTLQAKFDHVFWDKVSGSSRVWRNVVFVTQNYSQSHYFDKNTLLAGWTPERRGDFLTWWKDVIKGEPIDLSKASEFAWNTVGQEWDVLAAAWLLSGKCYPEFKILQGWHNKFPKSGALSLDKALTDKLVALAERYDVKNYMVRPQLFRFSLDTIHDAFHHQVNSQVKGIAAIQKSVKKTVEPERKAAEEEVRGDYTTRKKSSMVMHDEESSTW